MQSVVKRLAAVVVAVSVATLTACSSPVTLQDIRGQEAKLLTENISKQSDLTAENMKVFWSQETDTGIAVGATFEHKKQQYGIIGEITTGGNDPVVSMNYASLDNETAYSVHSSFRTLNQESTEWLAIVGGFVREPEIKQLEILYADGTSTIAPVDGNQAYYAVRKTTSSGVAGVCGLNQDGKRIYTYPPVIPQKIN